jgi:tRNA A37 threonylcarbamoyladenosine synthetase subunit TsaC/SUA5/YrdC
LNVAPPDLYHQSAVASYIRMPFQRIAGSMVKMLLGLGDRFAVTCTMVASEEDMQNPKVIERVCNGLVFIFWNGPFLGVPPDCHRDRYPVYSIFFLEQLRIRVSCDPNSEALIERTLEHLRAASAELVEKDRLKDLKEADR